MIRPTKLNSKKEGSSGKYINNKIIYGFFVSLYFNCFWWVCYYLIFLHQQKKFKLKSIIFEQIKRGLGKKETVFLVVEPLRSGYLPPPLDLSVS